MEIKIVISNRLIKLLGLATLFGLQIHTMSQLYQDVGGLMIINELPTLSQITSSPSMKCNDDPCNCPIASNFLLGQGGDIGFMYVIAGDAKYAREFRSVVDYLQNTLHIPDSITRQQDPDKYGRYKYALVTEPHLCKDILLDTTSFFDIILTVGNAKGTGSALNTGVNLVVPNLIRNPLLDEKDGHHRMMLETTKATNHDQSSNQSNKIEEVVQREYDEAATNTIGVVDDVYGQDKNILYWAKSVKVTALAHGSPFATTIFLDSDNIPCKADYGKQIEDLLEKAAFQNR